MTRFSSNIDRSTYLVSSIVQLALTLGRHDDAVNHLRHAVAANQALQAVVELAHSRVDLAAALGSGTDAAHLLEQAEAVASELRLAAVARRTALVRERFAH